MQEEDGRSFVIFLLLYSRLEHLRQHLSKLSKEQHYEIYEHLHGCLSATQIISDPLPCDGSWSLAHAGPSWRDPVLPMHSSDPPLVHLHDTVKRIKLVNGFAKNHIDQWRKNVLPKSCIYMHLYNWMQYATTFWRGNFPIFIPNPIPTNWAKKEAHRLALSSMTCLAVGLWYEGNHKIHRKVR